MLVKQSNLNYFIKALAKKHFVTKQMLEGSCNGAIVWCIKYGLARDKALSHMKNSTYLPLVDIWEDLPPLRMRQLDINMHGLFDKTDYSVYVDLETNYALEQILDAKGKYEQKNGVEVKKAKYPKFRNLKRNVVINCIKLVMMDWCEYTFNSSDMGFTLEGMMKHFGVEVNND